MAAAANNGNGKVTLAIAVTKIDTVLDRLDEIKDCIKDHDKRIGSLEVGQGKREEAIATLKSTSRIWNITEIIGIIGAAIAGIFVKG